MRRKEERKKISVLGKELEKNKQGEKASVKDAKGFIGGGV